MNRTFSVALILFSMALSGCGIQQLPRAQNEVEASWSEVVNQYKRRADLIPNLVQVVKQYAAHERGTLEAVVNARAKATQTNISADNLTEENMKKFQAAQREVGSTLSRLLVVAENYPQLKANENFRDLQVQLEGTENRITVARQRYIETVRGYNDLVTVPPTSWFNSIIWHYAKRPQFTVENEGAIQEPPKVNFQ